MRIALEQAVFFFLRLKMLLLKSHALLEVLRRPGQIDFPALSLPPAPHV